MENSNNNSNWKYIVGAGLGVAAGLYANSQKGKEHRKIASDYITQTTEAAKEKSTEVLSATNEMISDLKSKGVNYLASLQSGTTSPNDEISKFVEKEMAALEKKVNNKIAAAKQKVA